MRHYHHLHYQSHQNPNILPVKKLKPSRLTNPDIVSPCDILSQLMDGVSSVSRSEVNKYKPLSSPSVLLSDWVGLGGTLYQICQCQCSDQWKCWRMVQMKSCHHHHSSFQGQILNRTVRHGCCCCKSRPRQLAQLAAESAYSRETKLYS